MAAEAVLNIVEFTVAENFIHGGLDPVWSKVHSLKPMGLLRMVHVTACDPAQN